MKQITLITALLFASFSLSAQSGKEIKDSHSTIYTQKVKRIVNAINVGDYENQKDYAQMLKTACQRNNCSAAEKQGIKIIGEEIVHCRLTHLKAHGIDNSDARALCDNKQSALGCDTLANSLLRKMCYTGNKYSLSELQRKEANLKKRAPASK